MQSATLTRQRPGPIRLARLRAVPPGTWARIGFAAMCVGALIGYLAFPTYPTYDSFYALLWGRDLLHLHLPDFSVYRGPTEHPLAIAFGMLCSIFGQGGARLMVLGSIASFVAAVAGMYRLGRLCFGPVVGLVAALLLLSRFFIENLAAQGYLDITYVALIVWAVVLEVERPRRGAPVFLTLAAAGLLRPDAWVLSGAYWLWCSWPAKAERAPGPERSRALGQEPALPRAGRDRAAHMGGARRDRHRQPALLADRRPPAWRRNWNAPRDSSACWARCGPTACGSTSWRSCSAGSSACRWRCGWRRDERSCRWRRSSLLIGVYVAEGAVGASVVDRYLLGAATALLPFCAVTVGGWAMLAPGSWLRRAWIVGAVVLVAYGGVAAAGSLSLSSLRLTLAEHEDFHKALAVALESPPVKAQLRRCPLLSLPDNKLIPDARWILDSVGQRDIVARSQARADVEHGDHALEDRIRAGSVAVYPLGTAVFVDAIVDPGDDPLDQVPDQASALRGASNASTRASSTRCMPTAERTRRWAWAGLAVVLAGGLGLRLWGVRQGLPYAYNADEADHFVPHAIEMFEKGTLNPHYFANPPAFTYVLHFLFAVSYGGASGAVHAFAVHPDSGLHARARRRRGARHGRAVAAVRDRRAAVQPRRRPARGGDRGGRVPARLLRPPRAQRRAHARAATLSLLGTAGVLRKGRARDYLLAGVGLGLACATKYTAGIVIVPLAAAIAARYLDAGASRDADAGAKAGAGRAGEGRQARARRDRCSRARPRSSRS